MKNITFLVRGLGFGHAARDIIIKNHLDIFVPDTKIKFISYATGAKMIKEHSCDLIDIEVPDRGYEIEKSIKIRELIESESTDFIINDEEIMALSLSRNYGIPSVLITNWLPADDQNVLSGYFSQADRILIPDFEGAFDVPPGLLSSIQIDWLGPIKTKELGITRYMARARLGFLDSQKFILIMAGGVDSTDIPYLKKCIDALELLYFSFQAIVVAGPFSRMFEYAQVSNPNIGVVSYLWDIDIYIAASDLVITRGGHTSLWELAMMGIPSISVPRSKNSWPMNIKYAENMQKHGTTIMIENESLTALYLAPKIESILTNRNIWNRMSQAGLRFRETNGAKKAAEIIADML